jgi:hypothetical protein
MVSDVRFDPLGTASPRVRAPQSRLRRWGRRVFVAVAVLFFVVVGAFLVWRQYALHARDAEIAKLRAAGDPVWFADLEPKPLDPAEDGTPLLRQAFAAMKPLPEELDDELAALPAFEEEEEEEDERMTADEREAFLEEHGDMVIEGLAGPAKTLRELWAEEDEPPPGPREPFAVREKKLVEKLRPHVEANRAAFALLREALEKPKIRFDVDYAHPQPMVMDIADNPPFFELAWLLQVRLRCELHDGDEVAATNTVLECLGLARRHYAQSRELNGVLYACGQLSQAHGYVVKMLEREKFDAARRAEVSLALRDFESELRIGPAIRGEKAMAMTTIESFLDVGGFGRNAPKNWLTYKIVEPLVWMNEANYLRGLSAQAMYADRYDEEAFNAIDEEYDREWGDVFEAGKPSMYTRLTHLAKAMMQPAMPHFHAQILAARNQANAARVALEVHAFRREHGRLPQSLDEGKGGALAGVPLDLVDEEPLAYLVDDDAFAICPARHAENERKHLRQLVAKRDAALDDAKPPRAPEPGDDAELQAAEDENVAWLGSAADEVDADEKPYEPGDVPTGAILVVYPRQSGANAAEGDAAP